jgi:uncharacterized protein
MLAATGDARYVDLFEWTLYNGMLPGWSLDGREYYYVNPLENDGTHRRRPWYYCSCCPPNVARTIASLPGYVYGTDAESLYVHLYFDSDARIEVAGKTVGITQRTQYPWEGTVDFTIDTDGELALKLRIPGWANGQAALSSREARDGTVKAAGVSLSVNGESVDATPDSNGYVTIHRTWKTGDTVRLQLPMDVRVWQSHPKVPDNRGRIAFSRGPVLYCVEQADMQGVDLDELFVDPAQISAHWEPSLLDGVVALKGTAQRRAIDSAWTGELYRPFGQQREPAAGEASPLQLVAIPYFAWHNRESGPMKVWMNYREA